MAYSDWLDRLLPAPAVALCVCVFFFLLCWVAGQGGSFLPEPHVMNFELLSLDVLAEILAQAFSNFMQLFFSFA